MSSALRDRSRLALVSVMLTWLVLFIPFTAANAVMLNGEDVPLHRISADECRLCHMEIYEQWAGSMHAKSSAINDPIHRAFYKQVVGSPEAEDVRTKNGSYPVCLKCHAPNAAQEMKTKLDDVPAFSEGVNCVSCHRLKEFKGTRLPNGKLQLGIDAYVMAENCQGPSGFPASFEEHAAQATAGETENPHHQRPFVSIDEDVEMALPLEANPELLKTSAACLGCHDKRNNSHGVPLCSTGDEYVHGKTHVSCQSCHMPISGGFADHTMGGGHDEATLRRALIMKIETEKQNDTIQTRVKIKNQQPHKVPTGAPFRNMMLQVTAYNRDGAVVWRNYEKNPMMEDPNSYFHLVLLGDDGKPTSPPKAKSLGADNRLEPYETRTLTFDIPAKDVALVRAEMNYSLLWPGLKKALSFLPEHLLEAKKVAFAESRLH